MFTGCWQGKCNDHRKEALMPNQGQRLKKDGRNKSKKLQAMRRKEEGTPKLHSEESLKMNKAKRRFV
jgi:hypothetical protein